MFTTSYKNFVENYGLDEDLLFADARAVVDNEGSKVKYVPVYNVDGSGANRYVDVDSRTFCISLTNISTVNALSDIYMAGYAIWVDEEYNEYYTITTYDMTDGDKAVNLYEITLGLTKTGIINSENTDDVCFWQTLKAGALKTNEFNTANDATAKGYVLPEDGYFEYLDVDWHAYTGASTLTGWGFNPTGVDTQASGVVWSVLKYTDDEYVLVIRNKDKSAYTELSIPQYSAGRATAHYNQYDYFAPYDYRYGNTKYVAAGTSLTTYNPALTQDDYNKIKTLVVDHGITGTGANGFAGLTSVETIIYPNGLSGKGEYKFTGSTSVRNVIWCHTDNAGNPVTHLSEFKAISDAGQPLFDLRGMTTLDYSVMLRGCSSVENVVLPNVFYTTGRAEYVIAFFFYPLQGNFSYPLPLLFSSSFQERRKWGKEMEKRKDFLKGKEKERTFFFFFFLLLLLKKEGRMQEIQGFSSSPERREGEGNFFSSSSDREEKRKRKKTLFEKKQGL